MVVRRNGWKASWGTSHYLGLDLGLCRHIAIPSFDNDFAVTHGSIFGLQLNLATGDGRCNSCSPTNVQVFDIHGSRWLRFRLHRGNPSCIPEILCCFAGHSARWLALSGREYALRGGCRRTRVAPSLLQTPLSRKSFPLTATKETFNRAKYSH